MALTTQADMEAADWLLGRGSGPITVPGYHDHRGYSFERLPGGDVGRGRWDVLSPSNHLYRVEERPDTKKGGTYLHCDCPSWKFAISKGQECKHIQMMREIGMLP